MAAALESGRPVGEVSDMAISEFTSKLKKKLPASGKRPRTVKRQIYEWDSFIKWAKPLKLGGVRAEDIKRYRDHLLENRRLAESTTNNVLRNISSIFTFAIKEMRVFDGPNPVIGIRLTEKDDPPYPRYLARDEIEAVLTAAKEHSRDIYLFFALGLFSGMRKNEIINAKWSWIDFKKGGRILVQCGDKFKTKSGKNRVIPFHDRLRAILSQNGHGAGYIVYPDYPDKKDPTKYRVNCERAFKTAVKNARIEDFSPHTMRHTFASWLAIEGVSLYKIKSWLGHSNIKTTEIYAHLQPQDEDINRL
jgi:integrase